VFAKIHPEIERNRVLSSWPVALAATQPVLAENLRPRRRESSSKLLIKLLTISLGASAVLISALVPLGSKSSERQHSHHLSAAASRFSATPSSLACDYASSSLAGLLSQDSADGWQVSARSNLGGVKQVRATCSHSSGANESTVAVTWSKGSQGWQLKQIDRLP
jgi:hypothetical protein